jgi:outer membrane protein assembly factor BamE (lipoprotein component of BamABCDE complex)
MSYRNFPIRAAVLAVLTISTLAPLAMAATPTAHFTLRIPGPVPLNDAAAERIHPGMTTAQVEGLIGAPWNTIRFDNTHTTSWDYEYQDGWGYDAVFSVIFDDAGMVVSKISVRRDG